jgi:hypothetical protein
MLILTRGEIVGLAALVIAAIGVYAQVLSTSDTNARSRLAKVFFLALLLFLIVYGYLYRRSGKAQADIEIQKEQREEEAKASWNASVEEAKRRLRDEENKKKAAEARAREIIAAEDRNKSVLEILAPSPPQESARQATMTIEPSLKENLLGTWTNSNIMVTVTIDFRSNGVLGATTKMSSIMSSIVVGSSIIESLGNSGDPILYRVVGKDKVKFRYKGRDYVKLVQVADDGSSVTIGDAAGEESDKTPLINVPGQIAEFKRSAS